MRKLYRNRQKLMLTTMVAALLAASSGNIGLNAQGATVSITGTEQTSVSQKRVSQLHYGDLLTNARIRANLELLLQHLNSDKKGLKTDEEPWRFGPVVPKGFRFTANQSTLDRIIKPAANSSFGRSGKVVVVRDGKTLGTRTVELFYFDVAPTRNIGKPYTAAIKVARDVNTGTIIFVHSLVRQFEDNDPMNIHEFAIWDGSLVRLSSKNGETTIRSAYVMSAGVNKASADYIAKKTLPAAQRASSMFAQVQQFVTTDKLASQNQLATSTITIETGAEKEKSWWVEVRTELLTILKDACKEVLKSLASLAADFLKSIGGAFADALKSALKDFLGWLGL